MIIATSLSDHLNRTLPDWLRVVPICDGVSVHADHPACGSDRIVDLWRDVDGEWRWRSLYLRHQLSGKGTVFDGLIAVQEATKAAANIR